MYDVLRFISMSFDGQAQANTMEWVSLNNFRSIMHDDGGTDGKAEWDGSAGGVGGGGGGGVDGF